MTTDNEISLMSAAGATKQHFQQLSKMGFNDFCARNVK